MAQESVAIQMAVFFERICTARLSGVAHRIDQRQIRPFFCPSDSRNSLLAAAFDYRVPSGVEFSAEHDDCEFL